MEPETRIPPSHPTETSDIFLPREEMLKKENEGKLEQPPQLTQELIHQNEVDLYEVVNQLYNITKIMKPPE